MIHTMAFHAYTPIQNNIVVHALCIWGHTYSMYANVSENLTFLTPRYTYMYVHIGPGEGGGSYEMLFFRKFCVHIIRKALLLKLFLL